MTTQQSDMQWAERFMDAMGGIDEDLILSAEAARNGKYRRRRRSRILRYTSYAIAAALMVSIGIVALRTRTAAPAAGIDVAYVDVADLLATREDTISLTPGEIPDMDTDAIRAVSASGEEVTRFAFTIDGEKVLYLPADVSEDGAQALKESAGEAVPYDEMEGFYFLKGHEDMDYLIYCDAQGTYSLWKRQ